MSPIVEKILVLVRATPEESRKYGHIVCVAGLNEDNEWRRLYPFKFEYGKRLLDFKKKDMIEVELISSDNDKRKESRRVENHKNLFDPKDDDEIRERLSKILHTIPEMEENDESLCVVKPLIDDIEIIINNMNVMDEQTYLSIFSTTDTERREKVKMPIEVRYIFKCGGECCRKKSHKMIIIDWEVNELARNVLKNYGDKKVVKSKIREKMLDFMKTRDVYFILGTHFRFKTPMIIGIFYPKKVAN